MSGGNFSNNPEADKLDIRKFVLASKTAGVSWIAAEMRE